MQDQARQDKTRPEARQNKVQKVKKERGKR